MRRIARVPARVTNRTACRLLTAAAAAAAGFVSVAQGATFNVSWDGGAAGSYATAVNWSTNTVPQNVEALNDYYNVTINRAGGANVTGNLAQIEVLNLTLGANAGNQLTLADNCTFNVVGTAAFGPATVTNAGTIQLGVTAAAASQFRFLGSTNTLGGGGTISLLGSNANLFSSGTLTSNNTIVGFGRIATNFALVNNGTITAGGGSLTVDAGATGGLDNNNLMQSIAGGTLVLSGNGGGTFANGGGTIANNGGRVNLIEGATIAGGAISTLNLTGSSIFFVPGGQSGGLAGVTSTADVNVGVNATLTLAGTITNNGRIRTNSAAGVATFNAGANTTTLNGTGSLNLAAVATSAGQVTGTGTLVNGATHSIFGAGTLGNGSLQITNNGLISASIPGQTLYLRPEQSGFGLVNSGIVRAGPGELRLQNFDQIQIENTGTFDVQSGGTLTLDAGSSGSAVSIAGGTINVATGGVMRSLNSMGSVRLLAGVRLNNSGAVIVDDSDWQITNSHFANSGSVSITGDGGLNVMSSTLTLSGGGEVLLAGGASIGGPGSVNNQGNLIRGAGFLGLNEARLVNGGTVSADVAGAELLLDPGAGNFTNSGTLQATNGAILRLTGNGGGTFINSGTIAVAGSGTVLLADGVTIAGGTLTENSVNSRFSIPALNSATLSGVAITSTSQVFLSTDSLLTLAGEVVNAGAITMAGGGGSVTTAGGSVSLSGFGNISLGILASPGTLNIAGTLQSTNLIRGRGAIFNGAFVNAANGVVAADVAGASLKLTPGTFSNYQNAGLLLAEGGGALELQSITFGGGFINVDGGIIQATNGSVVRLIGTGVQGGTLSTTGTGSIEVVTGATLIDTTVDGRLVADGAGLNVGSIVTLAGTTHFGGGGTVTLAVATLSTLNQSGTLLTSIGPAQATRIRGRGAVNNTGTIAGPADFAADSGGSLLISNAGLIAGSGTVGLSFGVLSEGLTRVVNTGTLRADAGSVIEVGSLGEIAGNGTIEIHSGASFLFGGPVAAANTLNDGSIVALGTGHLGRLRGSGALTGGGTFPFVGAVPANLTVTHARIPAVTLAVGSITTSAGGGSLGTSRVTSLTLSAGTRWDLNDHDLVVDYAVGSPFAAILALVQEGYAGGSWNGNGLTSTAAATAPLAARTGLAVVEAGELFATFPLTFGGQSIDSTTVLVAYTLLGDANLDRTVNIADFSALAANFNQPNRWNRGDFNYDGVTGIADFALLASNFNTSLAATPARGAAAVPEPFGGLAVVATALAAIARRRRG